MSKSSNEQESKAFEAVGEMEDLIQSVRDYGELVQSVSAALGNNEGADCRMSLAISRLARLIRDAADALDVQCSILFHELHPNKAGRNDSGPHLVA